MPCEKRFRNRYCLFITLWLWYHFGSCFLLLRVCTRARVCVCGGITLSLSLFLHFSCIVVILKFIMISKSSIQHRWWGKWNQAWASTLVLVSLSLSFSSTYIVYNVYPPYMNIMNWSLFNFIHLLPSTLIISNKRQKDVAIHICTEHIQHTHKLAFVPNRDT